LHVQSPLFMRFVRNPLASFFPLPVRRAARNPLASIFPLPVRERMKVRVRLQRAIFFARDSRFCICPQRTRRLSPKVLHGQFLLYQDNAACSHRPPPAVEFSRKTEIRVSCLKLAVRSGDCCEDILHPALLTPQAREVRQRCAERRARAPRIRARADALRSSRARARK